MSSVTAPPGTAPPAARAARPLWRRARRVLMFVLSMALIAAVWEGYKAVGPQNGGDVLGWKILPREGQHHAAHQ